MAMRKEVETVIDRMVDLVHSRGSMKAGQVAKVLGITQAQVEELANVLADNGVINVKYTLTDVILTPRHVFLGERKKPKKREGKTGRLIKEMESIQTSIDVVLKEIDKRLVRVEAILKEGVNDEKSEALCVLRERLERLKARNIMIEKKLEELEEEMKHVGEAVERKKRGFLSRVFPFLGR